MLLIPSGFFSLYHGTMASASWGLFFLPSAQMYKREGCGPAMRQATQSQSCGRLSVALTRPKFLLPHSLETWRYIIAVVCLRLLWLPYLSQKKKSTKKQKNKPKQNQKTHTRLGTLSSNVSHLTVALGFLWQLWGRTHPGNGWHFLACGQITLIVTVTHGISPVCASLCEAVRLPRVSLRWLHPDCVHTSPTTK